MNDAELSYAIFTHDQKSCDLCLGAGRFAADHYAMGKLRLKAGKELGMQPGDSLAMPITEMMERWHALKAQR